MHAGKSVPLPAMTATDRSDAAALETRVRALLAEVPDPEIPVLSVLDLGIVRGIREEQGRLLVEVTPTYSGCPATEVIEESIAARLEAGGFRGAEVRRLLSPPWTTDWISDAGREKLAAFGIAPPPGSTSLKGPALPVACPGCGSTDTARLSEFGSTPCKAAYRCNACLEPFDHFKCI